MSQVFATSDLHLGGHEKIAEDRGFASTELHDAAVMASLYTIPRGSHLWIFGDLSSGRRAHEDHALSLLYILSRDLDLTLYLIAGNHDSVHGHHGSSHKHADRFAYVFSSVKDEKEHKIGSVRVLFSHLPYNGDSHGDEDRYPQQRPRDLGLPVIHGHVHGRYGTIVTYSDAGTLQVHVGFDVWKRPVAFEEIHELLVKHRKGPHTQ